MAFYLLRRVLHVVPLLLAVTLLAFLMIHLVPGDPVRLMLGDKATAASVDGVRRDLGLDRSLPVQYWRFISGAVRGQLGESIVQQTSVTSVIGPRIAPTLLLTTMAALIAAVSSLVLGSVAAWRSGRTTDHVIRLVTLLTFAFPAFWLGLLLLRVFGVDLGWFPIAGYGHGLLDDIYHLVLPALTVSSLLVVVLVRTLRGSLVEALGSDYVESARARGLSPRTVFMGHGLRTALIPTVTVLGLQVSSLVAGAIVTEKVFAIPGLGSLLVSSIAQRDYPVLQGMTLLLGVFVVLVNLATDLLYAVVDPRVRLGR